MGKDGIGCYLDVSSNESAYYKPLPVEENEVKVEPLLGKATWDEYGIAFRKKYRNSCQGHNMTDFYQIFLM